VEPLDTGNVELAGSVILTNGGATPVCKDDQINIIARANDGWRFDHWELDVTGTRATQVIVMTTSKKVRAIFVRIDERTIVPPAFYKLTVNGTDVTNAVTGLTDGAVKVSPALGTGELPYAQGTVVALTAQPAIGYELDHWGIDCSGSEPCVLTMDRNRSVEAIFRLKKFDLTSTVIPVNGGRITPSGTSSHEFGAQVTVTAEPNEGFDFFVWSDACTGSSPCTVTMDRAQTVQAEFKVQQHTLRVTAKPSTGGSITPAGTTVYDHGAQVALTAKPSEGHNFVDWTGDCSGTGGCSVLMTGDISVTANFIELPVLTTSAGTGGTVAPFGADTYPLD